MALMEKQILESDPQKYSEEWFNMANPTGKEFQLPNISKAPTMEHVPCNNSDFAHGQRSNNMGLGFANNPPPFSNTQSHLLFPISRPSPLRMYYGNNYLNGLGAMRSAAISHYPPLANNLADGIKFPVRNPNNPIFPNDHSTHEVKPNSSGMMSQMGCQTEMPTFPGLSRNYPGVSAAGGYQTHLKSTRYFSQFQFFPHIGESSTITTTTPISFPNNGSPPASSLDLLMQGIRADISFASERLLLREPEPPFCPVCDYLLSGPLFYLLVPKQEPYEEHPINPPSTNILRFGQPIDNPIFTSKSDNHLLEAERALKRLRLGLNVNQPVVGEERRNVATQAVAPTVQDVGYFHRCHECNVSFRTGNALGGHMSSHTKKRKRPILKDITRMFNHANTAIGINSDNANAPNAPAVEAAVSITIENSSETDEESPWAML